MSRKSKKNRIGGTLKSDKSKIAFSEIARVGKYCTIVSITNNLFFIFINRS